MQTRFGTKSGRPKTPNSQKRAPESFGALRRIGGFFLRLTNGMRLLFAAAKMAVINLPGDVRAVWARLLAWLASRPPFDPWPYLVGLTVGLACACVLLLLQTERCSAAYADQKSISLGIDGRRVTMLTHCDTADELYSAYGIDIGAQDAVSLSGAQELSSGDVITIRRPTLVYITDNAGESSPVKLEISGGTVADALGKSVYRAAASGGQVSPDLDTPVYGGMLISIDNVTKQIVTHTESIPYALVKVNDSSIYIGKEILKTQGQEGEKIVTTEVIYVNGVESSRTVISQIVTVEAVDKVISVGSKATPTPKPTATKAVKTATKAPSASSTPWKTNALGDVDASAGTVTVNGVTYTIASEMTVEITAYTHTGNKTATGTWPAVGQMAVDKSVIPLGTKAYVPGYGLAVATDVGVHGAQIDVFMNTEAECRKWGRRRDKIIYILE